MTLHFNWLHAPRSLARTHGNRAMAFVLGVIGVSLLFSALRIVDAAVSGTLVARQMPASAPAASATVLSPELMPGTDPAASDRPVDTSLDVPEATVEAISL